MYAVTDGEVVPFQTVLSIEKEGLVYAEDYPEALSLLTEMDLSVQDYLNFHPVDYEGFWLYAQDDLFIGYLIPGHGDLIVMVTARPGLLQWMGPPKDIDGPFARLLSR